MGCGKESPIRYTYKMAAIEVCLAHIMEHGYFVLDFLYYRINALEKSEQNMTVISERLAQVNHNDMVWNILLINHIIFSVLHLLSTNRVIVISCGLFLRKPL